MGKYLSDIPQRTPSKSSWMTTFSYRTSRINFSTPSGPLPRCCRPMTEVGAMTELATYVQSVTPPIGSLFSGPLTGLSDRHFTAFSLLSVQSFSCLLLPPSPSFPRYRSQLWSKVLLAYSCCLSLHFL